MEIEELSKLYSWADAKRDSDRLLQPRREHQIRVAAWKEFGYTITSMVLMVGWVGLAATTSI